MKKTLNTLLVALVSALALTASAQTRVTMTTLASAMTATGQGSTTYVNLTSLTCAGCPGSTITAGSTYLYVDGEFMAVNGLPGGNYVQVTRGYSGGGPATKHNSSALVFVGPSTAFQSFLPYGYCSPSAVLYLPWVDVKDGKIADCNNNQWVIGDAFGSQRTLVPLPVPPTGGTLVTALDTNGTAPGATTSLYCTQLYLPVSKYLTGLGLLLGTTVSNGDKHYVVLFDDGGNLLANSASAGVASGTASTYQQLAFTTPFYAVGPAVYFGCFESNGTSDTIRRVDTSANQGLFTGAVTGQTFGTIPGTISVPSSFNTGTGAWLEFY